MQSIVSNRDAKHCGTIVSFIRTLTVGPGVTPDLLTLPRLMRSVQKLFDFCKTATRPSKEPLAGYTAGGDFHPALSLPDYSSRAEIVCVGRPCKGAVARLRPAP